MARFLRFLKTRKITPAMALRTTIPATTPAAIPALFGPLGCAVCVVTMTVGLPLSCPGAVTTIVLAFVTTEGGPFSVGVG